MTPRSSKALFTRLFNALSKGVLVALAMTSLLLEAQETRKPVLVSNSDIELVLQKELTESYRLDGELKVQLTRPWQSPKGILGEWKLFILDKPADGPSASMIVRCAIEADGRRVGLWNLPLRAEWNKPAWFAKRPMERGDTLQMEDFELRSANVLKERECLPADVDLNEFTAARPISPGKALSWREVTARVLVARGAMVDVIIQKGALSISMRAEALETGSKGDRINLRNLESRKNIRAIVIDENLVQISL